MILTEYDIQYTTQKEIKGSILANRLAHQAVDDYQSMNFEFPDENIMLVIDYEEPGPDEGPEEGPQWTMVFEGAMNTLGNGIGIVSYLLRVVILLSLPYYVSTTLTKWRSMKPVSWVSKLLSILGSSS